MGKTGLIEHCFHSQQIKNEYSSFFIDIYTTSNLKEPILKMGKAIFEILKPKGKKNIDHFFSIITSLRPAFKLDPVTGFPSFDIWIGEIREVASTLEEILNISKQPTSVALWLEHVYGTGYKLF